MANPSLSSVSSCPVVNSEHLCLKLFVPRLFSICSKKNHNYTTSNVLLTAFMWETRKCSTKVKHKLAITDHADRHNCVIDWEGAKVVDKETNRCVRWIKEAIRIRKTEPTMNRDEGGYRLSHVWDSLLATPSSEQ